MDPLTLYAAGESLPGYDPAPMAKSTDGGDTWSRQGTGLPPSTAVLALVIDPTTPSTLYAGTADGVFKSWDAGATWSPAGAGIPSAVDVLAIDPTNPSTLYAGARAYGAYKSTDAGRTWVAANARLPGYLTALAIDPAAPHTLYAATPGAGVYRSTDAGGSWIPVNRGLASLSVVGLAIDPATGGVFAASDGVWQATPPPAGGDADLTLTISDSPDPVIGTTPVTYRIGVTNLGPDAASAVSVIHTLPAGVVFDRAQGLGWTCSETGGRVRCSRPGLAMGTSEPIEVRVTPGPLPLS